MKHSFYILVLLLSSVAKNCYSQIEVSYETKGTEISKPIGSINLHTDSRVDLLLERHKTVQIGVPYSGRGYRVQIYYGSDRQKARDIKIDFMRRHPDTRVYLTYTSPQYRVRVGNFATHKDAWDFYREISREYQRCMVLPDVVLINNRQKND